MFYLLFVLTFLAGILFYGLTPHDAKLDQDTHRAEPMIQSFLSQHQAAKDYVYTWMGTYPADASVVNLSEKFMSYLPNGLTNSVCVDDTGATDRYNLNVPTIDRACFVSRVVCLDEDDSLVECSSVSMKKSYIVTFGGWQSDGASDYTRPSWWPSKRQSVRRYERWRRSIPNRTRGSDNCGVLFQHGAKWCIDNGETPYNPDGTDCLHPVPNGIVSGSDVFGTTASGDLVHGPWDDMLICISPVKIGAKSYYTSASLDHFYDGLDNKNLHAPIVGHEDTRATNHALSVDYQNWYDLTNPTDTTRQLRADFSKDVPAAFYGAELCSTDNINLYPTSFPLTNFLQRDNFTLTLLIRIVHDHQGINFITTSETPRRFYFQRQFPSESVGLQYRLFFDGVIDEEETPLMKDIVKIQDPSNPDVFKYIGQIMSWTMVKKKNSDGSFTFSVYENSDDNPRFQATITAAQNATLPSGDFTITSDCGFYVYGIRYYTHVLSSKDIQDNFKVDSKRYGVGDAKNLHTS